MSYLLQNGCDFAKNNSKVRFEKAGIERIDKPDYADRAIFESLVNSLSHRDYIILGAVVIYNVNYDANGVESGVRIGMTKEERLEQIIKVIESDSKVTINTIAERLGVPKRTIDRDIAVLKERNKIRHVGPTKAGHWEIIGSPIQRHHF